jgi:hypothetical protein
VTDRLQKTMVNFAFPSPVLLLIGSLFCAAAAGCGTTRDKLATEQLLLSDAVDRAVARIDFSPLAAEKVYLDTTYLNEVKGTAFVNADYIISSLRQQMASAGCLLQEKREDARYIAEARVGVLGSDAHDVNYGVPGSNGLTAAASLVAGTAPLPSLPEISFARKTDDSAATKLAVFAYDRVSREPVWQSGLSVARSRAQARWLLGAGPFQSGSIYNGTQFAGRKLGTTPLQGIPKEQLSTDDQQYRNFAVYDDQLRAKLHEPSSGETLAAQGDEKALLDERPAKERLEQPGDVQQVEHTEELAEPTDARPDTAPATALDARPAD